MARHLRIRYIVTTDRPGAELIHAICGVNADGTHWTLTQARAISQIEDRISKFYIESSRGQRLDVVVAMDIRANKYLKAVPERDRCNELLFVPNCLHFAHAQNSGSMKARA